MVKTQPKIFMGRTLMGFGAIALLCTVSIFISALSTAYRGHCSRSWSKIPVKIVRSLVLEEKAPKVFSTRHKVQVDYLFLSGRKVLTGQTISFPNPTFSTTVEASNFTSQYEPDRIMSGYQNASDTTQTCLRPGDTDEAKEQVALAAIMFCFNAALIIAGSVLLKRTN